VSYLVNNLKFEILFKFKAFALGDPQIQTFDGLSYTFNGLGQYILSKAKDGSFEAQIETSIFANVENSSVSGTFITSIAIQTKTSPTVEIKLADYKSFNPYQSIIKKKFHQKLLN
jgi:hypothetical protein